MQLPEVCIKRPVFATVLSLIVLLVGLISYTRLPVREYPRIDDPVVSVTTDYRGASAEVDVKAVELDSRILIQWTGDGAPSVVEWLFTPRGPAATLVSITASGFRGDGDEVVRQALAASGGFALVLAGLKAFLEHGLQLNLIADRFPDQLVKSN